MAANTPLSPAAGGALSAFLRGAERRALVVAELQLGDPAAAEHALVASMRAFAGQAPGLAMADWPARFWTLLCSTPALRTPGTGQWPRPLSHLPQLDGTERLALLLRIGAGLDETMAAAVLGMSVERYRQALATACPLDPQGQPDAQAWRTLAEQVQGQVRDLDEDRLRRLLEPVLPAPRAEAPPVTSPAAAPAAPRRSPRRPARTWRWWWWGLPLLLLAVLVLGWWRSGGAGRFAQADVPAHEGVLSEGNPVMAEALPASSTAAAPALDLYAQSDAAMLADPDLGLVREADFHAWFAAGGPVPVDESQTQPTRPAPASAGLETADGDD